MSGLPLDFATAALILRRGLPALGSSLEAFEWATPTYLRSAHDHGLVSIDAHGATTADQRPDQP